MASILLYVFLLTLHWKILIIESEKTKLLSFDVCDDPVPPFDKDKDQKIYGNFSTYKKGDKLLVRGNVTLLQDLTGNGRIRAGLERNGHGIKYTLDLKGMGCGNIMTQLTFKAAKLKVDYKKCIVFKGTYTFDNLDVARIERAANFFVTLKERGVLVLNLNLYGPNGTYICFVVRTLISFG